MDKIEELAEKYHFDVGVSAGDHSAFRAALREMAAYSYRDASTDAANWLGGKWELSQILQRKAESVENGGK